MNNYIGLFTAKVYNTDKFIENGTIDINIDGVTAGDNDYLSAMLQSSFGGLNKMGLSSCPPIGALGYVMFPNGDPSNMPIWMGSPMIPCDLNTDKDDNMKQKLPPEVIDPTTIVLRSQYTKKEKGGEDLTSKDNKIESIVIINDKEFTLSKPKTDNNYEYLKTSYNVLDKKHNTITIKDDQIKIKYYEKSGKIYTVKIVEDNIEFRYNDKIYIKITKDGIELSADKSKIKLLSSGTISMMSDKYIQFFNDNDNFLKWSVFNEMINSFNTHTHMPGSDSPTTTPPLPCPQVTSTIIETGASTEYLTTGISTPIQKFKKNTRCKMHRDQFGVKPEIVGTNYSFTRLTTGSGGGSFSGLFGCCYTRSKKIKSLKNKL